MRRVMCYVIRVMDDMSVADIYIIALIRDNFKIEILAGVPQACLTSLMCARTWRVAVTGRDRIIGYADASSMRSRC